MYSAQEAESGQYMNTHAAMPHYLEAEPQNHDMASDGLSLVSLVSALWRRKMIMIVPVLLVFIGTLLRSEERRVGKEC